MVIEGSERWMWLHSPLLSGYPVFPVWWGPKQVNKLFFHSFLWPDGLPKVHLIFEWNFYTCFFSAVWHVLTIRRTLVRVPPYTCTNSCPFPSDCNEWHRYKCLNVIVTYLILAPTQNRNCKLLPNCEKQLIFLPRFKIFFLGGGGGQ